jgi:hypothetical protein
MAKSKLIFDLFHQLWQTSLRRKIVLIVTLFIVALVTVSSILVFQLALKQDNASKCKKSIVRDIDTAEKENALIAAENVNYSGTFGISRFEGWGSHNDYSLGSPEDYNSSSYPRYAYANFIDSVVIEYYDTRFETLRGKPMYMEFNYSANVRVWDKIHAVYVPPPENKDINWARVQLLDTNGTILFDCQAFRTYRYAYGSNSGIQEIQADAIDFEFFNCYIVEMKLRYDEGYGPVSGFFSRVSQTIIVDENFNPLLLFVGSDKIIS